MKEFAKGLVDSVNIEQTSDTSYVDAFRKLVDKKLSEPLSPGKREKKLYQGIGSFRQYLNDDFVFIFQGDSEKEELFFSIQTPDGEYTHEFNVEGDELMGRIFHFTATGELIFEGTPKKPLAPIEARELMRVMRNPRGITSENLPQFINLNPEASSMTPFKFYLSEYL